MTKVLVCGDSSIAESGFAQYNRAILTALHNHPDFITAEMAFSGQINQVGQTPWKFYPVAVTGNDPRYKDFMAKNDNRYGAWRFNNVLLHFRPDIVLSVSDPWQIAYQALSPLRPCFNWVLCPTVDSDPQKQEFLQTFHNADLLCTYTNYGKQVLKDCGLTVNHVIPMGVNAEIFKPLGDKNIHKKRFGLPDNSIIFGFVFRNQARKRAVDLLKAFNIYLQLVDKDTADRSYLYFSTTYPDQASDLPTILLEHGLWNKVYFTYLCHQTNQWFPSLFQDACTFSPFSGKKSAFLPNVMKGVTQQQLNEVYNCMDVYIQWAVCEGFGSPQLEAAATDIPVIAVNCTAMSEVAPSVGGEVVDPLAMPMDLMLGAYRAVMDNEALAKRMVWYATEYKPEPNKYRQKVLDQYLWEHSTGKWIDALQNLDSKNLWNSPPKYISIPDQIPQNMSVSQFIYTLNDGAHYQWLYHSLALIKLLNHGFQLNGVQCMPVSPDHIYKMTKELEKFWNACENIRIGRQSLPTEDYLGN